jgi:hypothetical protein
MGWADKVLKMIAGDGDIHKAEPYATASDKNLISVEPFSSGGRTDWWEIYPERWHQVFPYQFMIMQKAADTQDSANKYYGVSGATGKAITETALAIYTLPIPPQSVNVRMVSASQVTPTIGGVVEETSANTFWDITLSGTTGIAVGKKGDVAAQLAGTGSGGWSGALAQIKSALFGEPPKTASKFREVIKTTGEMSGSLNYFSKL